MAVVEMKNPGSLRVRIDLGMVDGKSKIKSKTYSNIKTNASGQDLFDVANAMFALQKYDVLEIIKQEYTSLGE